MNFNIFGIGKENPAINSKDDKQNEKNFGIKKGEKIGPLSKDTISISVITPEQEMDQEIKRLTENTRGSQEILSETLADIIKRGTENNPELLAKRIKILKNFDEKDSHLLKCLMFAEFDGNQHTSFLFDQIETIKNIFKEKQITTDNFEIGQEQILGCITPENYNTFLECAENENSVGDDFATLVMYKIQPHKIEFGNETAKVDSREIISLLSDCQSISTIRENDYTKFEEAVNSLVAKDYEKKGQQYYSKIVEGILSQKPELAEIANDYRKYIEGFQNKNLTNEQYINVIEGYFIRLELSGILPQQIELKTIIPDENALPYPIKTLKLFLAGKTTSQENKE